MKTFGIALNGPFPEDADAQYSKCCKARLVAYRTIFACCERVARDTKEHEDMVLRRETCGFHCSMGLRSLLSVGPLSDRFTL